jgi:ABC-2 type transport system ATP-binding protein
VRRCNRTAGTRSAHPVSNQEVSAILEAHDLTKRFSALTAVRGISFAIAPGEVLGVLGPNGAGKSTIVKMVTGLLEPSRGVILFRGERIDREPAAYKRNLGYVPEQPELYGFLTGWEYLEMVAGLRRLDARRFREKAAALLEGFGLYGSRDVPIASYSKGMRQRIVLIAAILHNPEVLVLDEPFSGLDIASVLVLRRVIQQLAACGKAIFFSSPVLEQVDQVCSHLVVLKQGAAVAAGAIDAIRAEFTGLGLEHGFMQLTEQVDADKVAGIIVAAAVAAAC